MKKQLLLLGIVALCVAVVLAGCQSYGAAAGTGAGIGALTGAIIGHQSGHAGEGALIGAAVGAGAGLIAHDIKVKRARSAEETKAQYGYNESQGEVLTLETSQALPSTVMRGNMMEATIQYAIMGTGGGVQVRETRTVMRNGGTVSELSSKTFTRTDGTWVSTAQFEVPERWEPGTYTMVQTVQTPSSRISDSAVFTVQ